MVHVAVAQLQGRQEARSFGFGGFGGCSFGMGVFQMSKPSTLGLDLDVFGPTFLVNFEGAVFECF